jgi:hypothetical protein
MASVPINARIHEQRLVRTDGFYRLSDYVQSNWQTLSIGDRAARTCLAKAARNQLGDCLDRLNLSSIRVSVTKPYSWTMLIDDGVLKAGLLQLPKGGLIPAHDHPNTIGITQVVRGNPVIIQGCRKRSGAPIRHQLKPNDLCLTFPERNNIHSIKNHAEPAILLTINIAYRHRAGKKKWCFSLDILDHLLNQPLQAAVYGLLSLSLYAFAQGPVSAQCLIYQVEAELAANNYATAATLLEDCAVEGLASAQCLLGNLYFTGKGVAQDHYTAAQWYRMAAEQGIPHAQYLYGVMLLEGVGITEDRYQAMDWIFRAMSAGHGEATQTFEYLLANPEALDC